MYSTRYNEAARIKHRKVENIGYDRLTGIVDVVPIEFAAAGLDVRDVSELEEEILQSA